VEPKIDLKIVDQAGAEIDYDVKKSEPIVVTISGPARFEANDSRRLEIWGDDKSTEQIKIKHIDDETEGDITITATHESLESASLTLTAIEVGVPRNIVV